MARSCAQRHAGSPEKPSRIHRTVRRNEVTDRDIASALFHEHLNLVALRRAFPQPPASETIGEPPLNADPVRIQTAASPGRPAGARLPIAIKVAICAAILISMP